MFCIAQRRLRLHRDKARRLYTARYEAAQHYEGERTFYEDHQTAGRKQILLASELGPHGSIFRPSTLRSKAFSGVGGEGCLYRDWGPINVVRQESRQTGRQTSRQTDRKTRRQADMFKYNILTSRYSSAV